MKNLYNILRNKSGQYSLHKRLILMEGTSWISAILILPLCYLTFYNIHYIWFIIAFGYTIYYMEKTTKQLIISLVNKNKDRILKELDEVFKNDDF